jgi:hypothetical protein
MGGHAARSHWDDAGLAMLVGGLLLPPFAWLLDLQVSYAMTKWACENDRRDLVLLMPLGSLALVAVACWMSWTCWRQLRSTAEERGERREDRSYFLALGGLAMSGIFALLILISIAPRYFLSPCE